MDPIEFPIPLLAVTVVWGYEYHDDYIQLGTVVVTVADTTGFHDGWTVAANDATDLVFTVYDEVDDLWCRVESIERVR